jgi:hypothetical protein
MTFLGHAAKEAKTSETSDKHFNFNSFHTVVFRRKINI